MRTAFAVTLCAGNGSGDGARVVMRIMSTTETATLRAAIRLLQQIAPEAETSLQKAMPVPRQHPVREFAEQYLARDPTGDKTSNELFSDYNELVAAGDMEPLSATEFLRALPAAMLAVFGIRKRHNIVRDGKKLRGFRGVGINHFYFPMPSPDLAPEPKPEPEPAPAP